MRIITLAACLAACDAERKDGPTSTLPTSGTPAPTTPTTPPDTAEPTPPTTPTTADLSALQLPPAASVANGRFSTSDVCAECHSNAAQSQAMRDEDGDGIGPYDLWRSVMMANSARDPIWRAQVSAEVASTPAAAAAIEAKCLRCHAPMASVDAELVGDPAIGMAVLTDGTERSSLALDGVSCTACHQIEDLDLGTDASFSGGYTILGQQRIYGPHANPFAMPMIMRSGFTPVGADHVRDPGLCATCHTLEGHTLDLAGAETGESVIEQGPYLEWAASDLAGTTPCQGCHLPTTSADGVPIATAIARSPGGTDFPMVGDRSPYGRHLLVGGNTLAPRLFQEFRSVLNPAAPDEALDATLAAARASLASAATVTIAGAARDGDTLVADVVVRSLTGHKLPSGIPVRRLWLRATVTDDSGAVIRDVGASDARGRLLDGEGAVLPSDLAGGPVVPHLDAVTSSDTVQVWESVLADTTGAPTWRLTRAAGWVKDNRLLPPGFDATDPSGARVLPVGTDADPDFGAGGDTVHLALDVTGASRPLTLDVAVLYQPLSARWAAELAASGTPEAAALEGMLEGVGNAPETVATASASVP